MKFSAVILAIGLKGALADFFRNDFLPVGHVRTDAIITPDCLSDHVHTFYGPPLLYPALTFEDLRKSDPSLSSGNIEENNSLYWHPAVYHVAGNGIKTLQESEMTTVYYNWIPGKTTAFPPGFRMVTPGEQVFDEGVVSGENEMEISISFQSCWDGVNLDSSDHMSHVAFPNGEGENAKCPNSHPKRIPRLDFFIRWFNTKAAKWEFSDGTGIFHADYVSGWDENFLQELLDGGDGDVDDKVTFRAGIKHTGNDQKLIEQLNKHAVPYADTSCITTENFNNIINLPREECTGTLISPTGDCNGPSPTPPSPTQPTPPPSSTPSTPTPPSLNPPTGSPSCQDSPLEFAHGKKDKMKTCSWVGKKETRCDSKSNASHCPVTCESCDEFECANSKKQKIEVYSDEHMERLIGTCSDLLEEDADLCNNVEFFQTCRELCGFCG